MKNSNIRKIFGKNNIILYNRANNALMLYCTRFDFCREHGGLAYEDRRGIKCKNTPAKGAKITESKWTLRDLLTFRCFKTSTG